MFRFFRINDPYRLLGLLIILVLIRLPILIYGAPLLLAELKWMIVAEKMVRNSVLYLDIWDNLAPLSACVYAVFDYLFGRSTTAYHIFSIILIFLQSALFNSIMLKNRAYHENTYVPAVIYMILMNLFFDFFTTPPVLLSLTFVLLAMRQLFSHLEERLSDEGILTIGFLIGVAGLFFYTNSFFIVPVFLIFALFTGSSVQKYLLLVYGFGLPFLLTWIFFYWKEGLNEYYINFIYSIFTLSIKSFTNFYSILLIIAVPMLFYFLSLQKVLSTGRFNNHQAKIQQSIFFFFIAAFISWFFIRERQPFQLMIFAIPVAFFLTHYFLLLRNKFFVEVVFIVFFATIIVVNYGTFYYDKIPRYLIDYQDLLVKSTDYDELVDGKKILVLGDNLHLYKNATLAGPYLNWQTSSRHLTRPEYYDNLTTIYQNFVQDLPEVIIDEKAVITTLFDRMPGVAHMYEKKNSNIYVLTE